MNDQKNSTCLQFDLFNGEVVSHNLSRIRTLSKSQICWKVLFKSRTRLGQSDSAFGSGLAIPDEVLPESTESKKELRKACLGAHLFGQCCCRELSGLLKTELFYLVVIPLTSLKKAIIDYIDHYNNRRIKLKLNGLSPVQYRFRPLGPLTVFCLTFGGSDSEMQRDIAFYAENYTDGFPASRSSAGRCLMLPSSNGTRPAVSSSSV